MAYTLTHNPTGPAPSPHVRLDPAAVAHVAIVASVHVFTSARGRLVVDVTPLAIASENGRDARRTGPGLPSVRLSKVSPADVDKAAESVADSCRNLSRILASCGLPVSAKVPTQPEIAAAVWAMVTEERTRPGDRENAARAASLAAAFSSAMATGHGPGVAA